MEAAFEEAYLANTRGEVPVGAVIVDSRNGAIIARSGNHTEAAFDPTAHAEIMVLRQAGQNLQSCRLPYCDIYVTLEPCPMCAQAIAFARIRRLFFAAYDKKGGGVMHGPCIFSQPSCHHQPEIYGGIRESEAEILLKQFFAERR